MFFVPAQRNRTLIRLSELDTQMLLTCSRQPALLVCQEPTVALSTERLGKCIADPGLDRHMLGSGRYLVQVLMLVINCCTPQLLALVCRLDSSSLDKAPVRCANGHHRNALGQCDKFWVINHV